MSKTYFLYSDEQITEKNKILEKTGKKFEPGYVVVGGKRVKFSQLSSSPTIDRFIDTKSVASGDLGSFIYEAPKTVPKRG